MTNFLFCEIMNERFIHGTPKSSGQHMQLPSGNIISDQTPCGGCGVTPVGFFANPLYQIMLETLVLGAFGTLE